MTEAAIRERVFMLRRHLFYVAENSIPVSCEVKVSSRALSLLGTISHQSSTMHSIYSLQGVESPRTQPNARI